MKDLYEKTPFLNFVKLFIKEIDGELSYAAKLLYDDFNGRLKNKDKIIEGLEFKVNELSNALEDNPRVPLSYDDELNKERSKLLVKLSNLENKLNNVVTNQIPTSQIFLQDKKKKLTVLKKKVDLGEVKSGILWNSTINIPNGYELDRIILKEVK